jgi:hypothetical protein
MLNELETVNIIVSYSIVYWIIANDNTHDNVKLSLLNRQMITNIAVETINIMYCDVYC